MEKILFVRALTILLLLSLLVLFLTYGLKKYEDGQAKVVVTPTLPLTAYPTSTPTPTKGTYYAIVVHADNNKLVIFDTNSGTEKTVSRNNNVAVTGSYENEIEITWNDIKLGDTVKVGYFGNKIDNISIPTISSEKESNKISGSRSAAIGYISMNYLYIGYNDGSPEAKIIQSNTELYINNQKVNDINLFKAGNYCKFTYVGNFLSRLELDKGVR